MNDKLGICCVVGALPLEAGLIPIPGPDDLLIAADGGYTALSALGIAPHLVVGDFDSLPRPAHRSNVIPLPRIKDETDTGFALGLGLERGYRRFLLLGCLGGRLDHSLANLQHLAGLSAKGCAALAAGEGQRAAAITGGSLSFPPATTGRVSVFCAGDRAEGVCLSGLKYPLEGETLTHRFPLGVSNEFLGLPARVSVARGTLLVVWEGREEFSALSSLLDAVEGPGIPWEETEQA